MAVASPFAIVRTMAIVSTIVLVAVVTAFTYDSSALPFVDDSADESPTSLTATPVGTFTAPVEVFGRAGSTDTFVVEQVGRVVRLDGLAVLDIADRVNFDGEQGLLGAAFHPSEAFLYAHYIDLDGDTVLAEYPVTNGVADATAERTVLAVDQPYVNHNGGELTFGPDGLLYLGLGDGGLANDPDRSALDLSSPLGKILRIDPIGVDGAPFAVPAMNPFVDVTGADPTVWSYGLRNPWKFSFDPANGDLWIADVGQDQWEEINQSPAINGGSAGSGANFGWSAFEGDQAFNVDQVADDHHGPLFTYPRTDGQCSISGGAVYRGEAVPGLDGWYLFADFCSGVVSGFDTEAELAEGEDREVRTLVELESLAAVAAGGDGELYAVSIAGDVYRLGAPAA